MMHGIITPIHGLEKVIMVVDVERETLQYYTLSRLILICAVHASPLSRSQLTKGWEVCGICMWYPNLRRAFSKDSVLHPAASEWISHIN